MKSLLRVVMFSAACFAIEQACCFGLTVETNSAFLNAEFSEIDFADKVDLARSAILSLGASSGASRLNALQQAREILTLDDALRPEHSAFILMNQSKLLFAINDSIESQSGDSLYCKEGVDVVGQFLKRVLSAYDPDYKEQKVYLNLMPPLGTPNAVAGMSPEDINDSALRETYKARIAQNRMASFMNMRQNILRNTIKACVTQLSSLNRWKDYVDSSSQPWSSLMPMLKTR